MCPAQWAAVSDVVSSPPSLPPIHVVAASLLRLGGDTRGPRAYRALGAGAGARELALALDIPARERADEVRRAEDDAGRALAAARALGVEAVAFGAPGYPAWLSQVPDPPIVLWAKGDWSLLDRPAIAIVGSRKPTAISVAIAERLAGSLARAGLVVTSGLAAGVDGAAHEGALRVGGPTVAVLGCGPDVVYPARHASLAAAVGLKGCLVSEFPPGTPPRTHHFPLRNRIISGLSRGVVVVEAAERSGSLITARLALEQGRGVLAVPGCVVSGCHKGCHALIKDGARLVETVEDVLEEMGWRPEPSGSSRDKPLFGNDLLNSMEQGVPVTVDRLVGLGARSASEVLAGLAELEVAGCVRRLPGGWFVRLD